MPTSPPSNNWPNDIPGSWKEDPVVRHCRREAIFILCLWCACFAWTTTYCYLYGYLSHEPMPPEHVTGTDIAVLIGPLEEFDRDPATLTTPLGLGIPDWAFYGIMIPWGICIIISLLFCRFIFVEDDLSDQSEKSE